MEERDKDKLIESLLDANSTLNEELSRLRRSNQILRKVNQAIRSANESMRTQIESAQATDDVFRKWCEGEFDPPKEEYADKTRISEAVLFGESGSDKDLGNL